LLLARVQQSLILPSVDKVGNREQPR
jgi:hypothetical protein